ncbi:hypothetical protein BGZ80_009294 [Entomortierella chlamydospora]|uniref:Phosphatidylglycerol/phosphatidylinositol transfer protein n=1 Tax=Entomortierella chlamydospora TaxID=101097 RepID=A0A9P6MXL1_9FUNG|nr:hypothetical protein BGZ80_009294 [Entomortierella chlamydospora]
MKYISSLATIAAFLFSTTAASSLGVCPGNESLFSLRNARFDSDSIYPTKEICIVITGNLDTDLPSDKSSIEFTVGRPDGKPFVWSLPIYSSIKTTPETSPVPIIKGNPRVIRPCFYFPTDIAVKSGETIAIRVQVKTRDSDNSLVRVSCVETNVHVS